MERSCSLWRRREFWDHSVPPNTTRSTRLSLCGCDLTTSISSPRTSYGNNCESAQTDDLPRQPSKKYSTRSRCFAQRSSRARGHLKRMDTDGLEELGFSPKKSHQRSQSTGCVLVRKAPTTPHSQATAPQAKDRGGLQGRPRWGFKRHPRQGVNVQSTWPGCEVELGTCHCLPYYVHLVHTRVPFSHTHSRRVIADDRESILCGGDPPRGLSDETTSLGTMATAMQRKPTPALQHLEPGRLLLGE